MAAPRAVFYYKAESSPGTYTDPLTGGQALAVRDLDWKVGGEPQIKRFEAATAQPGILAPVVGAFHHELSCTVDIVHWGDTSSATGSPLAPLFGAAPMTITAGASDGDDLTVDPALAVETAVAPISILLARQGQNQYLARGCVVAVTGASLDGTGRILSLKLSIAGLWQATPAATAVNFANVTYPSHAPVQGKSATVDLGPSGAVGLSMFEFTTGQAITQRADVTEAHGYRLARVEHSDYPTLKYNVEAVVDGTFAIWAEWLAAGQSAISLLFAGGSTSGSPTFSLQIPLPYVAPPTQQDDGGDDRYEIEATCQWSQSAGYSYRFVFGEVA